MRQLRMEELRSDNYRNTNFRKQALEEIKNSFEEKQKANSVQSSPFYKYLFFRLSYR